MEFSEQLAREDHFSPGDDNSGEFSAVGSPHQLQKTPSLIFHSKLHLFKEISISLYMRSFARKANMELGNIEL